MPRDMRREDGGTAKGKYALFILGETLRADALGALFASAVDALYHIDPDAVERLSAMRARTRAYIARQRGAIHPGRPDLKVLRSRSGWWVSANVGRDDVERALRALCKASGLIFGQDVRLER
jgi:hypothetical protein